MSHVSMLPRVSAVQAKMVEPPKHKLQPQWNLQLKKMLQHKKLVKGDEL